MCDCDPFGSELNSQGIPRCNGVTGECVCRPTAEGERCDLCQVRFSNAGLVQCYGYEYQQTIAYVKRLMHAHVSM